MAKEISLSFFILFPAKDGGFASKSLRMVTWDHNTAKGRFPRAVSTKLITTIREI